MISATVDRGRSYESSRLIVISGRADQPSIEEHRHPLRTSCTSNEPRALITFRKLLAGDAPWETALAAYFVIGAGKR
jgi:hypothetical protein